MCLLDSAQNSFTSMVVMRFCGTFPLGRIDLKHLVCQHYEIKKLFCMVKIPTEKVPVDRPYFIVDLMKFFGQSLSTSGRTNRIRLC